MVLILLLSLLTIGFAKLARHEQQDTLNNQLAAQAQYAAESGVHDAERDIANGYITQDGLPVAQTPPGVTPAKASDATCMTHTSAGIPSGASTYHQTLNAPDGVSYSCLLVNLNPSSLTWSGIGVGTEQYETFSTPGGPPTTLTVSWGSSDGHTHYPTGISGRFPPFSAWHDISSNPYAPVLQVNITPLNPSGSGLNRTDMQNNMLSAYLYPTNGAAGSVAYTSGMGNGNSTTDGQIIAGHCSGSGPHPCSATITCLDLGSPCGSGSYEGPFLVSVVPYYDSATVSIAGTTIGSTPTSFTGQAQIDVTAQAHNVLKRLVATIPLPAPTASGSTQVSLPAFALQAQDICKRLSTDPNTTNYINPGGTSVDPPSTDPCTLSTN